MEFFSVETGREIVKDVGVEVMDGHVTCIAFLQKILILTRIIALNIKNVTYIIQFVDLSSITVWYSVLYCKNHISFMSVTTTVSLKALKSQTPLSSALASCSSQMRYNQDYLMVSL